MMRAKPIQTTKWGTACAQCAAAKAKCSRQTESRGSRCDRCERLLKQCTDQVHRPRKVRQPRQSPRFTNKKLSSTFDGYRDITSARSPSASDLGASSASSIGDPISRPPSPHRRTPTLPSTPSYTSNAPSCSCQLPTPVLDGPLESGDKLLDRFRVDLMPYFPFVVIPRHVAAESLQKQKPFLMAVIRMVAGSKSAKSTCHQMYHVMSHLASHVFLGAERSLDVLMGVVVVLGWYHYHCIRHSQLNNLLCLAESVAADLGLWRGGTGRSNEDKRLVLGVWYLRSLAAVHFHLLGRLPWTNTLSQYAADLKQAKECQSDLLLVELVNIQHVTEQVTALETTEDRGKGRISELQAKLDGMSSMASSSMVTTDINTALLRTHEVKSDAPSQQSLASIKTWFESWLSDVSPAVYHILPTTVLFQLTYAVVVLFRWTGEAGPRHAPASRSASPTTTIPNTRVICDAIAALESQIAEMGVSGPEVVGYMVALGERRGRESGLLSATSQRNWPAISETVLSAMADRLTQTICVSPDLLSTTSASNEVPVRTPCITHSTFGYPYQASYTAEIPIASIEDSLPGLHVSHSHSHPHSHPHGQSHAQIPSSSASPAMMPAQINTPQSPPGVHTQWASWEASPIWMSQLTPSGGLMERLDSQLWFSGQQGQGQGQAQAQGKEWEREVGMEFEDTEEDFLMGYGAH